MSVGEGLDVCGWSFKYAETFVGLYLAESADGILPRPVEYYYLDEETVHRADVCGASSRACTRSGVVYAQTPLHTHEIVHALRQIQFETTAAPGALFFEEGIAQWHYPIAVGWDDSFRPLELPQVVEETMPARLYDPAAQVLSVVGDDTSFETVEALVDASATIETGEDVRLLLEDELGIDLEQLDALYLAQPECSPAARSRMLVECSAEPLVWLEAPWSSAPYIIEGIGELTCDDPRILGPLDGRLWMSYTLDIPADGLYELETSADPGQRLQLTSCDTACGADVDVQWDESRREDIELQAGRYVVRLSREVGDEHNISLQMRGPLPS